MAFKVYKSSAGSGKTFTLVKEYVKLCLKAKGNSGFSFILAITFTNKATAEMKDRILSQLKKMADATEKDVMTDMIQVETGLSYEDIQAKSKSLISNILHQYGDFNISTIDRFTHKLVRTFARDLGVPMNFQVVLDEREIMQKVVASLINEMGRDEYISELLKSFMFYQIEQDKNWKLDQQLFEFSRKLLDENSYFYLKKINKVKRESFEETRKELSRIKTTFEKAIISIGEKGNAIIKAKGIEPSSFYGRAAVPNYFKYLEIFKLSSIQPTKTALKAIEEDKWHSGKCPAADANAIDSIKSDLTTLFWQAQEIIEKDFANYLSAKGILENLFNLQLAQAIEQRFTKIKQEEQLLHISDFNKKIAEVVLEQPMPFVYERLGEKYSNVMVDEFQDTSLLQFINLLPLIEESLSNGNFSMLVGDAKQAIYRFRGGVSEQFAAMPEIEHLFKDEHELVIERLQTLKQHYQEDELKVNRRSRKQVIDFNNRFFDYAFESNLLHEKAKRSFASVRQDIPQKEGAEGYVEVKMFDSKSELEDQLAYLHQIILEALAADYRLKDIAVLCRRNDKAIEVAEYLKNQKIDVLSSEALMVNNSVEVQFLIAILSWINNPKKLISRIRIIQYLCDVNQIQAEDEFPKYASAEQPLEEFIKTLGYELNPSKLQKLDLFSCFESLIRIFSLNHEFDIYVQFLQEYVFEYSRQEGNQFEAFLTWWEENQEKLSLDITADLDAVKIMTIHKSKGLEFPIAIIPFAEQEVKFKYSDNLWVEVSNKLNVPLPYALIREKNEYLNSTFGERFQEELISKQEDFLNDTYVAFTRAVDRLYVLSKQVNKPTNLKLNTLLFHFIGKEGNATETYAIGSKDRFELEEEDEAKDTNSMQLEYLSEDWRKRIAISSDLTAFYGKEETEAAISYGNLMHEVLAKVGTAEELKEVLNKQFLQGKISQEEQEQLHEKLQQLLSKPEIQPYFQKGIRVFTEQVLFDDTGKQLRPDRLVQLNDGSYFVIDYKTGKALPKHHDQLRQYVNLVSEITNSESHGALLYLEEENWMPLF